MVMGFFKKLRGEDNIVKEPIKTQPTASPVIGADEKNNATVDISSMPGESAMEVDDVFSITGRGTVVTGRVAKGAFRIGQSVTITSQGVPKLQTRIVGIEAFRKTLDTAVAGDNCGLLLENVQRDQVCAGDVVSSGSGM